MNDAVLSDKGWFDLDDLKALVAEDMQRVNQIITDHLSSDIVLINQLSQHIILSGGKRLRPMLVLLAAKSCQHADENVSLLAAVIEFIHTATLLHDDVVDGSEMRRGQQSASHIWGNDAAVLVGDYLYSRAFQMMVQVQSMPIMSLLSNVTNTIAEGEVLQLLHQKNPDTDEAQYRRVIYSKTVCLFEAATRIGAILGGSDAKTELAIASFGRHFGAAFQLVDDVLDYNADSQLLGKNIGDDLAEGKPTLPLIYALREGDPAQTALIRKAILQGGLEHIDSIIDIMVETGAFEYSLEQARVEAERAKSAIAFLPPTDYKTALIFLADYAVNRHL